MAVKDGLGPRPVAQTAKRYFLNWLETSSKPWLYLRFCTANGPPRRAQPPWPASSVQSSLFAPSCILLLVRPPLTRSPLLAAGVGGYSTWEADSWHLCRSPTSSKSNQLAKVATLCWRAWLQGSTPGYTCSERSKAGDQPGHFPVIGISKSDLGMKRGFRFAKILSYMESCFNVQHTTRRGTFWWDSGPGSTCCQHSKLESCCCWQEKKEEVRDIVGLFMLALSTLHCITLPDLCGLTHQWTAEEIRQQCVKDQQAACVNDVKICERDAASMS